MKRKLLVGISSTALALVCGIIFWSAARAQTPTPVMPPLTVTSADLVTAGFHGVQAVSSQNGAYALPNVYFRTQETVASTHPEWAGAANLVAVLIVPTQPNWSFNGGASQVSDISGRTQIKLSRPGYYIVVTGPDKNLVTALGTLLQKK